MERREILEQISEVVNISYLERKGTLVKSNFSKYKTGQRQPSADELKRIAWNIENIAIVRLQRLANELRRL